MLTLADINTLEADDYTSPEAHYSALQRAINSGSAWSLQGSYGRAMMEAIEAGYCLLGHKPARDYWGNRIPSRDEVKPGTKGSYDYVADAQGAKWAEFIAGE